MVDHKREYLKEISASSDDVQLHEKINLISHNIASRLLREDGTNNQFLVNGLLAPTAYTVSMLMKNYMRALMEPLINEAAIKREKSRTTEEHTYQFTSEEDYTIKKIKTEDEADDAMNLDNEWIPDENEPPEEDERDSPQDEFSDQDLVSDFVEKSKAIKEGLTPSEQRTVENRLFTDFNSVHNRISEQFKPSEPNRTFTKRPSEARSWKSTKNKGAIPRYDDAVKLTEKLKNVIGNNDDSSD